MTEEKERPIKVSRRDFVKGAAVGAGLLTGAGALASCGTAAAPTEHLVCDCSRSTPTTPMRASKNHNLNVVTATRCMENQR